MSIENETQKKKKEGEKRKAERGSRAGLKNRSAWRGDRGGDVRRKTAGCERNKRVSCSSRAPTAGAKKKKRERKKTELRTK